MEILKTDVCEYPLKKDFYMIFLENKLLQNTTLSKNELSVILGGLLGDGSLKIHPGYKNARYSFRHSIVAEPYFMYKAEMLKGCGSPKSINLQKADGWSTHKKLRFCTRALESLTCIYHITHKNSKKRVKRKWLNHLSEHSLAIWWCDDGSIIGNGRKGCICTDNFTHGEQKLLAAWLNKRWGVKVKIHPVKNKSKRGCVSIAYRLYLPTSSLKVFLTHILPWVPTKSCLYKMVIKYKDKNLQERWISHAKNYIREDFWPDYINLVEKKI